MKIEKNCSTINTTYSPNRNIKFIVIHYTAGTTSKKGSARNTANWFMSGQAGGSADYIVDDEEIVQYNADPENRFCWSVGGNKYTSMTTKEGGLYYGVCTNKNSISIEMCSCKTNKNNLSGSAEDWYFTEKTIYNAAELTRHLMYRYNVPIERVIMHHHVTGKICPNPFCVKPERLKEWVRFKNIITGKDVINMDELKKIEIRVGALENYVTEKTEKVFDTLDSVPDWGKETVIKLIDKGALKGDGKDLNLNYTLLRVLVINDRLGLYD